MPYTFSGIFADGDLHVLDDLRTQRAGSGRLFETPFRGFGFAFGGEYDFCEAETTVSLDLIEWSGRHPSVNFVYLWVECEGGQCEHAGFAFRDGRILHEEARAGHTRPLRNLLKYFGIELNESGYLEPLTRRFFFQDRA
jgi:hypothetical protein